MTAGPISPENYVDKVAVPETGDYEPVVLVPYLEEAIGRRALDQIEFDGFEPMEEIDSPFEYIRQGLNDGVVGQPAAIDAIIKALDMSEARVDDVKKPKACFAFLGPTGTGKSWTPKLLSKLLSDDGKGNLIQIDCSDYSHGHEVSGLTGAPNGYKDSGKKTKLDAENVSKKGTIILFDEIEKGSPELYNLMLQIMGDGKLELNNGTVTYFRDAIIVMTSNLGAHEMARELDTKPRGFGSSQKTANRAAIDATAISRFEDFFTPEFVNRITKEVVFHPLSREQMSQVLDLKVAAVNHEYAEKYGLHISLSSATRDHIVDIATTRPDLGARPLERAFEAEIQSTIGRYIGANYFENGTHVRIVHRSELSEETSSDGGSELRFLSKLDLSVRRIVSKEIVRTKLPKVMAQNSKNYSLNILHALENPGAMSSEPEAKIVP